MYGMFLGEGGEGVVGVSVGWDQEVDRMAGRKKGRRPLPMELIVQVSFGTHVGYHAGD